MHAIFKTQNHYFKQFLQKFTQIYSIFFRFNKLMGVGSWLALYPPDFPVENPDNRAFIIGSLLRLTGSVTILTIEIITGLRDDLIVTTKINVFYFYFLFLVPKELNFSWKHTVFFLKYLFDFGIMCCAISRNFRGQKEKKLF